MIPTALADLITAEPFRPFRIRMADGRSFDVRSHETISVGRTRFRVQAAIEPDRTEEWHDDFLDQIEAFEPLEA